MQISYYIDEIQDYQILNDFSLNAAYKSVTSTANPHSLKSKDRSFGYQNNSNSRRSLFVKRSSNFENDGRWKNGNNELAELHAAIESSCGARYRLKGSLYRVGLTVAEIRSISRNKPSLRARRAEENRSRPP